MERKMDIVLEGTLGKVAWVLEKQNQLMVNGYSIGYKVMAVNPQLSKLSTLVRYTEMKRSGAIPRFVTPDAHDERFNGLQLTVETLAKQDSANIALYTREIKHNINGAFTDSLKPLEKVSVNPLDDFKKKTRAPLSLTESDYIRKSISILMQNGISESLLKEAFPGFMNNESKKIKI